MPSAIDQSFYPQILAAANEGYDEPIDRVESARFDIDGNIIALGYSGDIPVGIKIGDDDVQVRLFNPQAVAGETAQMAAAEKIAPDLVDSYVDQMRQQFPFKPWLQQAKELLMQSPNLEDYSAKLVNLYPEMPSDDFNQIMIDALTAASMAGYFDAGADEFEFASSESLTIPVSEYPTLLGIIDNHYTNGLDEILSARQSDDGSIICVGRDEAKQIAIKITDEGIKLKLLDSAPHAPQFAAPKKNNGAIKKKVCKVGFSCGGSCISKAKICARALSISEQRQFKELNKRLKGGDLEATKGIQALKDKQQVVVPQSKTKSPEPPSKPAARQMAMFIDVSAIKTNRPASDFDPKDIDAIADSILESGGLYRPLLLKKSGAESFEVIPGNEISYHAAMQARAKDKKMDMVNGFITGDDYIDGSASQIDRLKSKPVEVEAESDRQFVKKSFGGRDDKSMYVDVSSIKSSRPASDFDPQEIEDLADSMLANGGLLRPIVLGQTGAETHEVIDGHLAYHAAVRAKQKDAKRGEMVNGFVISPGNIANVVKQLRLVDARN